MLSVSAGTLKKMGANEASERFRGGLTTNIHAIVDAAEIAVALSLMSGQRVHTTDRCLSPR